MLGRYSFPLIIFYASAIIILASLFYLKTKFKTYSFFVSFLVVLVGSEYYEIPNAIAGYLGMFNYGFPYVLHHINIIWFFIVLVLITRIKFTKKNVLMLALGPVMTCPLLFFHPWPYTTYLARTIGLTILGTVFYSGCCMYARPTISSGIGGKKVEPKV